MSRTKALTVSFVATRTMTAPSPQPNPEADRASPGIPPVSWDVSFSRLTVSAYRYGSRLGIWNPLERFRNRGATTSHCEEDSDEAISSAHRDRRAVARDDLRGLSHCKEGSESANHSPACPKASRKRCQRRHQAQDAVDFGAPGRGEKATSQALVGAGPGGLARRSPRKSGGLLSVNAQRTR